MHTSEPWCNNGGNIWNVEVSHGRDGEPEQYQNLIASSNEANAARIVACVNACAGVSKEFLEKINLAEMLEELGEFFDGVAVNQGTPQRTRTKALSLAEAFKEALKGDTHA